MRAKWAQLARENDALRRELSFLRAHPKLALGLQGEKLVLSIVNGVASPRGSDCDVITRDGRVRLEKGRQPGRRSVIHLTTNPASIRSGRAVELFHKHQVTARDLERRYRRHQIVSAGSQQSNSATDNDTVRSPLRAPYGARHRGR